MYDVQQMKLSYIADWCEAMQNVAMVKADILC